MEKDCKGCGGVNMISFENVNKETKISDSPIYKVLQGDMKSFQASAQMSMEELDKPISRDFSLDEHFTTESALYGDFDEAYLRKGFESISADDVESEVGQYFDDMWANSTLESKAEIVAKWSMFVAEKVGLKEMPTVEIYPAENNGEYGSYCRDDNTVRLNENTLESPQQTFNTIAHELWHAHQWDCACEPKNYRDIMYHYNLTNYISPELNFDLYKNQLVESEARAFAEYLTQNAFSYLRKV